MKFAKTNKQCPRCGKRHTKYPQACLTAAYNSYGYVVLSGIGGDKRLSAKRLLDAMSTYANTNWAQEA